MTPGIAARAFVLGLTLEPAGAVASPPSLDWGATADPGTEAAAGADDRGVLTRILRAVLPVRTSPGSFSFTEATAVAAPNTEAQVSIQRIGGTVGAFDLLYSMGGSGCRVGGTFGPVGFGDGDAVTRTISVPMVASGVCTVIMNPPAAPAGFGPHTGIDVTVVPVVAGCPRPSNVVSAALQGIGNPILQRQLSGQTTFLPLPTPSAGRTSGQITFTESAGGAYTPQPVVLEISISRCPGIIETDYANFCNLRSTNGNYNAITFLSAASQSYNRDNASRYGLCWAGDAGQYYVNARWTYSSCGFGATTCGFAIQYNDGPY